MIARIFSGLAILLGSVAIVLLVFRWLHEREIARLSRRSTGRRPTAYRL